MKSLRFVAAMLLGIVLATTAALAQAATDAPGGVSIPVGDWLAATSGWVAPLLAGAGLWLIRKLPSQIAGVLMTMRADQLLEKAVSYAINAVAGATKGKSLDFTTGSKVADQAVNYVVSNGPGWLINWLGGADAIRQKVIARLDVEADAALK